MKRSIKTSLLAFALMGLLSSCGFNFGSKSSIQGDTSNPTNTPSSSETSSSSSSSSAQSSSSFHTHTASSPVEENKIDATCIADGSYDLVVYCSSCGEEMSREHKVLTAKGHALVDHQAKTATCTEIGWNAYQTCSRCDYTTYQEIPATGHIHTATREELIAQASCTEPGSYDLVTYCTDDNVELSRETKVIEATGHDIIYHDAKAATCTEIGWQAYETCSKCYYTTYQEIPATGHVHTYTAEVDRVEPTCTEPGSYELVTYCLDEDNKEISRETKTIEPLGHANIHYRAKEPTCSQPGYYAYDKCARCGYSTKVEIPALNHRNTATKQMNKVEATCLKEGSYDLVTYCQDCNMLISSDHIVEPALGHDIIHHEAKEPTATEIGWYAYDTCSRCNYSTYVEIEPLDGPQISAISAGKIYKDYVNNNVYSLSSTPSKGTAKLLVVPVWFSDSNNYIKVDKRDGVRSDIQKAYFGTNAETGWRSVKTYYEEESHGALTLTGTVTDWYVLTDASSKYTSSNSGGDATVDLVNKAADWYFSNHSGESRKDYDRDGDGYLDGVMLIYARPDYRSANQSSNSNLWAYCYWVQDTSKKNVNNPGANAFFWASYDFMYGSNIASSKTGQSALGGGDTSHCSIDAHTYIHEMGHMFGLEDYYDYSNYGYSPAGGFSMQDYNVGGHDPYSSFALGWGKAYVPTQTITIKVKPFATTGEMIVLSPAWNSLNSPFDEYLILEYYTPNGLNQFDTQYQYSSYYPKGTTQSGIRLWHVDSRLLYKSGYSWSASRTTTNPSTTSGKVTLMMSNTYNDGHSDGYITPLGSSYADYNLLQLIRNNKTIGHKTDSMFGSSDLFKKGSSFSLSDYNSQFIKSGTLNNGKALGYSFTVNDISSEYATITVTKA